MLKNDTCRCITNFVVYGVNDFYHQCGKLKEYGNQTDLIGLRAGVSGFKNIRCKGENISCL
jgi:hypothetical protein